MKNSKKMIASLLFGAILLLSVGTASAHWSIAPIAAPSGPAGNLDLDAEGCHYGSGTCIDDDGVKLWDSKED